MRVFRYTVAALLLGLAAAAPASAAHHLAESISPQTRADLVAAAHGEAFAHAKYFAYAAEARRAGYRSVAQLFMRTHHVELHDHFMALASLAGLIGSNADNLRDAIAGEDSEATTLYPQFAAQALTQGDTSANDFWTELAGDEATHRDAFAQALTAITTPSSGATIPTGPTVDPYPIAAAPPRSTGVTLENLMTTIRGESFAHAKYMTYGEKARHTAQPALAALWRSTAAVELGEHFAEGATRGGLIGPTVANLREAIQGEITEATQTYPGYASQAAAAGDREAADLFTELAQDEAGHAAAFEEAL